MNHYRLSNGDKISKSRIDALVKNAKKKVLAMQIDEHGWNFCEVCGTSAGLLDCSHTISVNECQKSGKSELAFDVDNIKVRCRKCHDEHDSKSKHWHNETEL